MVAEPGGSRLTESLNTAFFVKWDFGIDKGDKQSAIK